MPKQLPNPLINRIAVANEWPWKYIYLTDILMYFKARTTLFTRTKTEEEKKCFKQKSNDLCASVKNESKNYIQMLMLATV